jgi:TolA-binding protein
LDSFGKPPKTVNFSVLKNNIMKIKIFALVILPLLFFSCSSSKQNEIKTEIEKMEKALETAPTIENAEALVGEYHKYIEMFPDDIEQNAMYLFRGGSAFFRLGRFSGAVELLREALKNYYSASNTANAAMLLGVVYEEKLQDTVTARTVYQCMIDAFPQYEKISDIKEKVIGLPSVNQRLDTLRMAMFDGNTGRPDYRLSNQFINSCELHALILPKSDRSPALLHQAGEAARSIRAFSKALELYAWIMEKYPDHEKASQALFLRAFTLDNDMQQYEEAGKYYEEFLKKYPDDDFADDTRVLLEHLGMSEEEIIKSFEAKQKQQNVN